MKGYVVIKNKIIFSGLIWDSPSFLGRRVSGSFLNGCTYSLAWQRVLCLCSVDGLGPVDK